MKKPTSKVPHNQPPPFFMYWPGCPNGTETEILYHQKPLNADCRAGELNRLGLSQIFEYT